MREVVGQNRLDLILTKDRALIGAQAKVLIQQILDAYGAGIRVREVRMQPVSPPQEVTEAFQDVQAARADRDNYINQASAYANNIIPNARGEAEAIRQKAEAYRLQAVAEAQGESQRFIAVLGQYRTAREVTRKRLYLETMERVLGGTNKVVLDSKTARGVLPYLPLPKPGEDKAQGGAN
jgi:membrane protease subunit HflK